MITSTVEVVSTAVFVQNMSKSYERILVKLFGGWDVTQETIDSEDFDGDPAVCFAQIFHPIMHFLSDSNSLLLSIRWQHYNARGTTQSF